MTHLHALAEAIALVDDETLDLRTLEPASPASTDEDFYADDPAALGLTNGRWSVTPTSAGEVSWVELVRERPEFAEFAGDHWLVPLG
jgi:hypothetical protein